MMFCIRGAFCIDAPNNSGKKSAKKSSDNSEEQQMIERVHAVMSALLQENGIRVRHIKSISFTQTEDILSNPAACLRKRAGYENIALFCMQEPRYRGMLPRTVRLLVTGEKLLHRRAQKPVYLFGAEALRSDLFDASAT